jgi:hypothetical protein
MLPVYRMNGDVSRKRSRTRAISSGRGGVASRSSRAFVMTSTFDAGTPTYRTMSCFEACDTVSTRRARRAAIVMTVRA